jgi:hypothetical protein
MGHKTQTHIVALLLLGFWYYIYTMMAYIHTHTHNQQERCCFLLLLLATSALSCTPLLPACRIHTSTNPSASSFLHQAIDHFRREIYLLITDDHSTSGYHQHFTHHSSRITKSNSMQEHDALIITQPCFGDGGTERPAATNASLSRW